jgi:hypothetical protein
VQITRNSNNLDKKCFSCSGNGSGEHAIIIDDRAIINPKFDLPKEPSEAI